MALSFEESMKKINTQPATFMAARVMSLSDDTSTSDEIFELNENYKWYNTCYSDDQMSYVDDAKNITVNPNQHCVTQENNSQCIPFELNRYYDGVDLNNMSFTIHYLNSENKDGIAMPVNFYYSDSKIRFGWLLDNSVTYIDGNVTFEIVASGFNEKDENYLWRTRPNGKINILKSLTGSGPITPTQDWYTEFITKIDEVERGLENKLDKTGGIIDGDLAVCGELASQSLVVGSVYSPDDAILGIDMKDAKLTRTSLEFGYTEEIYDLNGNRIFEGSISGLGHAENDDQAVPFGQMMEIVNQLISRIEFLESYYTFTFAVNGEQFVAPNNVTWQEFINSPYNPTHVCESCGAEYLVFVNNSNGICCTFDCEAETGNEPVPIFAEQEGAHVSLDDVIVPNHHYYASWE